MKSIIGLLAFSLMTSTAFAAAANKVLVCKSTNQKLETTISVKELNNGSYIMTVYKTISGHAVAPYSEIATQLRGTRGSVVAYGNKEQTLTLLLNLSRRNSEGKFLGTYTNSIQKEVLEVTCN